MIVRISDTGDGAPVRTASDRGMESHFRIVDLRSIIVTPDGSTPHLRVQSLQIIATRDGLDQVVRQLGPRNVDLTLSIAHSGDEPGADVIVQASRWGLTATMRIHLRLQPGAIGVLHLELAPGRIWSPTDQAMLAIVRRQVASKSQDRPEFVSTGPRTFTLDIQHLVTGLLDAGGLPVQWGAVPSGIDADERAVRLYFTPVPENVDVVGNESRSEG